MPPVCIETSGFHTINDANAKRLAGMIQIKCDVVHESTCDHSLERHSP